MKRIIYEPLTDTPIPDAQATVTYTLPQAGATVFDLIVADDFMPRGTVYFDSTVIADAVTDENGNVITPAAHKVEMQEPFIHHFTGLENI